ncbi:MAG: bifunctional phosphoribosyl-AMP cyclohydrolase/phosphoribosyl-ATP diphosphatase HisIE [Novibacillus thermophilus]|jgi:phosphoribosyl-ATP pyrophosphohydrolase/phosphoribosyl-AMP cyclohydrolase|uniref:Histidine biosynthesis bifunctional protein HisIE n=1 Tax=Novibacillus thermophilus TaxID=1471761 RepID=A0A1U9KAJ3_9BACL|nr:bifunctional phosphoribosyl-AMP cyclohydrolase/phosphoribosyl-ATP diphosphatase HisIE [Novibacillus thermophilus]AQS57052.1 bifunctional phosphoribosyl-AMP cyclohydrolase/phosphoribosyl-ATP pyrophosphatase [Novibacillus thermophilus]
MVISQFDTSGIQFNENGLVPVIVQDAQSKTVLTLAYMNEEALKRTVETGETWFWSRSRQELWHKGATSGHTQQVVSLAYDCDRDALLVQVNPDGPACHTGAFSCFSEKGNKTQTQSDRLAVIRDLEALIAKRDAERPEGAYTTYLFEEGVDKILKKVGEEASEVIIAAKNRSASELQHEVADLLFHLLVLLQEQKLPLDNVLKELQNRQKDR